MTPNIAIIRIQNRRVRGFPIVLPVFLLWIPVILLSPFILLVILGVSIAGRMNPWRTISAVWGLICGLPGTDVRVCADGNHVTVRIL